jgi:hypothetical protein
MRGKYSPTVTRAYMKDQEWWTKYAYANVSGDEFVQYDPEGYDSYGYDKNDMDRAGNNEFDYIHNDGDYNLDQDYNNAYDQADREWGFDGVKPVRF